MRKTRIFILSLQRERQRRLASLSQILPTGLAFELVDAIDSKMTRRDVFQVPGSAWPLHEAEVACYLSHFGILQRVCDYDLDHAIILEDDFMLTEDSRLTLDNLWTHLPADADHVQLHNDRNRLFEPYRLISKGDYFNRVSPTNVGGWAYVVSRKLAEHIVTHHRVPKLPIDHLFIELSKETSSFAFYDTADLMVGYNPDIPSSIDRNEPVLRARKTFSEWWKERWIRQ